MEVEPSAPPRGAARLCPEARSRLKASAIASNPASAEISRLSSHISHLEEPPRAEAAGAVGGYTGASCDLERELGEGAAAPAARVAGRGQTRHRLPAGDQDHHGVVPRGRGQRARLRG